MNDEFAVAEGKTILYKTEGFRPETVTDTVPLSGGKDLLICSQSRELLMQQLREAEEAIAAKDTFLSNMSHDIRTPMNAIMGLTLLAKMHLDETSRVSDALNKIETASAHLLSLINDVLDMSRMNSGRMQINPEAFSLNDLIHEVMTIIRPQAVKKGHHLHLITEGIEAESLIGDILRLRQICVNIINNSIKYTEDQGEITIRFSEEMQEDRCLLIFECEDNGIGMSEEFLEKIFEPFERVENAAISKIEGTGLGMSIVKKLTEAMGGTIVIRSKPGEGTAITIRIPLDFRDEELQSGALRDRHLLILESDSLNRSTYDKYLGEFGIAHEITATAEETLNALADADFCGKNFDLIIIGQECGSNEDKLDIAAYLHKSAPDLPILLISDDNWEEITYRAEISGIVSFIPLPIFRKSLINGLAAALENISGPESTAGFPDLSGKRILLVEDNMINREIALEILGMTGANVDTAENGKQGVDVFTASPENTYFVILMDVQMPIMNGYQAAEAIRAGGRSDSRTVPIYAMTANTFAEDIARARAAGMNGHIAKPIDINALMQVLRSVIS